MSDLTRNINTNDAVGYADYLVIGAGVSGLALAGDLHRAGHSVRVLDKGRGVGGRCATRRFADGGIADYGAQYFTAQGERFVAWVDAWLAEPNSELREWNRGYPAYRNGAFAEREPGRPRYAPKTGMNAVAKRLAAGVDVRTGVTVSEIARTVDGWAVSDGVETYHARRLCLSLPAEQLLRLAGGFLPADARARLAAVRYDPAWTLVARLSADIAFSHPAAEFKDHPVLGFLSRDHTKRADPSATPTLVVHASGVWSRDNLESEADAAGDAILDGIAGVFGDLPPVIERFTHRWRYALPTQTFGAPFFIGEDARLSVCGDGCGGIRLENALTTGWDLATALLRAV